MKPSVPMRLDIERRFYSSGVVIPSSMRITEQQGAQQHGVVLHVTAVAGQQSMERGPLLVGTRPKGAGALESDAGHEAGGLARALDQSERSQWAHMTAHEAADGVLVLRREEREEMKEEEREVLGNDLKRTTERQRLVNRNEALLQRKAINSAQ